MTAVIIVALIGIFTIGAVMRNVAWLWFLAGACAWALGVWLISNPLVTGADPLNDIVQTLCWLGGFGLMTMMGLRTRRGEDGTERLSFSIRLPAFLGGRTEGEETAFRNAGNYRARRQNYEDRLNNVGRR